MNISAQRGLEALIPFVQTEIEKAVHEREYLGMPTPEDFDVVLGYHDTIGGGAYVELVDSTPVMFINSLRSVAPSVLEYAHQEVSELIHHLDTIGYVFTNHWDGISGESMFGVFLNPEQGIKEFESSFNSEEEFESYKKMINSRGVPYEHYKELVFKSNRVMKKKLGWLIPIIERDFPESIMVRYIRHEVDHLDSALSPMYRELIPIFSELGDLERRFYLQGETSVAEELKTKNSEVLERYIGLFPVLELKAMFFDHIEPFGWHNTDPVSVQEDVLANFTTFSIKGIGERMLHRVVSFERASDNIDDDISNFILGNYYDKRRSPKTERYIYNPEKIEISALIDARAAWEGCMIRCKRQAEHMAPIIARAYEKDPRIPSDAIRAGNLGDFVKVCNGS